MEYDLDALARDVLAHVNHPNYRPVKPKVIAKKLELEGDGRQALKRVVKRLVRQGKLIYGANHLVMPLAAEKVTSQLIEGTFKKTQRGFGFVTPTAETRPKSLDVDIYIPASRTLDAANGDLVSVKIVKPTRHGRDQPLGHLVDVLERRTKQFVGTYLTRRDQGYVRIDGNQFPDPVKIVDASVKRPRDGDKVVVEMLRFPSERWLPEAVITEVLGRRHDVGVDTLTVIREFDLPEGFPEEVLDQARDLAAGFEQEVEPGRRDLTGDTIITIDPQDARDFDDAISLRRLENGHWLLGVHIADVSHFVRPNTPADNEAYRRGNSVYLPDRVIPMLPELISNGLASLQPEHVRYTVTAQIEMTAEGARVDCELYSSAIRSCRRFTYEEVDDYLEQPEAWRERLGTDVHQLLGDMHELAMVLRERRFDGGALELFLPETKVDLDEDGKVAGAHFEVNTVSHQMIEEFMLAANMAVAEHLEDEGLFYLRRVHPHPSELRLKDLTDFVKALGVDCESLQSRFEIRRVIEQVHETPEKYAVNYAVLRSMQKAVYGPQEEGHYALNVDSYCHFTSPIRRYPDLVIHRMVKALAEGHRPANEFKYLAALGDHCSATEQKAERAERELNKLKILNFLVDKVGEELDAVITGAEVYGLFVQGTEFPAEGLVGLPSLPQDHYDYDSVARCLTARRSGEVFRLGDPVRVRVARVDLDRRELDFELLHHLARPRVGGGGRRGAGGERGGSGRSGSGRDVRGKVPRGSRARGALEGSGERGSRPARGGGKKRGGRSAEGGASAEGGKKPPKGRGKRKRKGR